MLGSVPTRESVVAEARSWIPTPYVPRGMVKHSGCDCATFIACVLVAAGLAEPIEIGVISDDWFQHTSEEKYMRRLLRHASRILEGISYASHKIEPGNIVLARVVGSKVYNHGAIVTRWPMVIQSTHQGICEVNASKDPLWSFTQIAVFDPFRRPVEC